MDLGGLLKELLKGEVTSAKFGGFIEALYSEGVSDLHIDPNDIGHSVRARQGKQLVSLGSHGQAALSPMLSLVKTKASLKPHRTATPEEGLFTLNGLLVKAFSLPTVSGEKLSLQLIRKNDFPADLSKLGFWGSSLKAVKNIAKLKNGLICVVGDDNLRTMMSLLAQFDARTTLVSTIESSQTAKLPLVNQFVAERNYAELAETAMRVALKQGSDVIMISRLDTAPLVELATEASLSGKLVIAGLPLEDSFMAPGYLEHLGARAFMLASQLRYIVNSSRVATCPSDKLKVVKVTAEKSNIILRSAEIDAATLNSLEREAKKDGLSSNVKLGSNDKQITTLYTSTVKQLTKTINIVEVAKLDDRLNQLLLPGLHPSEVRELFIASGGITKETDHLVKALRKLVPYGNIK